MAISGQFPVAAVMMRRLRGRAGTGGRRGYGLASLVASVLVLLLVAGCGGSGSSRSGGGSDTGSSSAAGGFGTGPDQAGTVDLTGEVAKVMPAGAVPYDRVTSISCRDSLCMTMFSGVAIPFNGHRFGKAVYVFPPFPDGSSPQTRVSCVSSSWCMALSNTGTQAIWDGSKWSTVQLSLSATFQTNSMLGCASSSLCYAIGPSTDVSSVIWTYSDGNWSSAPFDSDGQTTVELTCPSANRCVILGGDGDVWTNTGSGWLRSSANFQTSQSASDAPASISCVPEYCLGVTHLSDNVVMDHGQGFQLYADLPVMSDVQPGACGSASFCPVESGDRYGIFTGAGFTPEPGTQPVITVGVFLSCGDGFCVNSDGEGPTVVTYRKP